MPSTETEHLKSLGTARAPFTGLETFNTPERVEKVTCICDEVTSMCPVTGQPDQYIVEIEYFPRKKCVESKTLKLYLQTFRNQGHFCEAFASIIAKHLHETLECTVVTTVKQKSRGGISIHGRACFAFQTPAEV